jgi:hypothetical protein
LGAGCGSVDGAESVEWTGRDLDEMETLLYIWWSELRSKYKVPRLGKQS